MDPFDPSPFAWLKFDESGRIDPGAAPALTAALDDATADDLVVISHGWKNDERDALDLYSTLWLNTCAHLGEARARRTVVAGVLWPAKAYETDFDQSSLAPEGRGGALAAGAAAASEDLPHDAFDRTLASFRDLFGQAADPVLTAARDAASGGLTATPSFRLIQQCADLAAMRATAAGADPELKHDAAPIVRAAADPDQAQQILAGLALPPELKLRPDVGRAQGIGTALQGLYNGSRAAVARFLNQLTYFEMKKRAGVEGAALSSGVLATLTPRRATRVHLIGHSFGARLVTAAADAWTPQPPLSFASLTLLQGAFSHNAFAEQVRPGLAGAFPKVVGKPLGPISITHTHKDLACTLAYALASRLSRDVATGIGDASDEYGAMGANGPQRLPVGVAQPDDAAAAFKPVRGKINTFLADAFIVKTPQSDAHNNVANAEVGRLVAATLLA